MPHLKKHLNNVDIVTNHPEQSYKNVFFKNLKIS